jgi:hypothetical protein
MSQRAAMRLAVIQGRAPAAAGGWNERRGIPDAPPEWAFKMPTGWKHGN